MREARRVINQRTKEPIVKLVICCEVCEVRSLDCGREELIPKPSAMPMVFRGPRDLEAAQLR